MNNQNFKQQEILLMFNTNFSERNCYQQSKAKTNVFSSGKQLLKDACWRGMVPILLPECFDFKFDKSMHLWEMNEADAFIELEFSEFLPSIDKHYSVNPYLFLTVQVFN